MNAARGHARERAGGEARRRARRRRIAELRVHPSQPDVVGNRRHDRDRRNVVRVVIVIYSPAQSCSTRPEGGAAPGLLWGTLNLTSSCEHDPNRLAQKAAADQDLRNISTAMGGLSLYGLALCVVRW